MDRTTKDRLLFVLHRAWVESRLLSREGNSEQAEELADLMEIVRGIIAHDKEDELDMLREGLAAYTKKFESRFDYLACLEAEPPAF